MTDGPIYLDCAATTRVDPRVVTVATAAMLEEFGNAGSRTHQFGSRAKALVDKARSQIALAAGCAPGDVIFTSGATEADNLAILGMAAHGAATDQRHIVSTGIEHKAVLEPLERLRSQGFEVTLVEPNARGWVEPAEVAAAVRPDTLLISVMQVNNETGVVQPIADIAEALMDSPAFFHVDAAQGFTKDMGAFGNDRVDFVSLSGHKISGPKGIGALIARPRDNHRPPVTPLMLGGGQERGFRPGTLPVHLIAAFGMAAELGQLEFESRRKSNETFRSHLVSALAPLAPIYVGDQDHCIANIVNLALPGVDSEAFILATKDLIAISNGSACTSHRYEPSHVLEAMAVDPDLRRGAVRISWNYDSEEPDWSAVTDRLRQFN
jgi:cysteine desulfurase